MNAVLATLGVSVRFGNVVANNNISITVSAGELAGLIGPNGAGKTTFLDAITGFVPSTGNVKVAGHDISRVKPHGRARRGLVRTWQSVELFEDLNVIDNLRVATEPLHIREMAAEFVGLRRPNMEAARAVLDSLGLTRYAAAPTRSLSLGQRKLVGVARALVTKPHVLLLDEPAAGLDADETAHLRDTLRSLADAGQAMLLIDHDMSLVMAVCDRVHVLNFGVVIAHGTPTEVQQNALVIEAYLGSVDEEALP